MKKKHPAAFMTYVHADDKYGHLSTFRERLGDEVQVQIGREFPIFQDRKDIQWGKNWKQRIEDSLDEVTFLIPIITPSFFNSQPCREELQRFLDREKQLGRTDLILPIYFVDCPLLNDEKLRAKDELAQAIASRQYADWRDLRFEPFTNPQVGKTLARLAVQIRDALPSIDTSEQTATTPASVAKEAQPASQAQTETSEQRAQQPSAKNEPPTHIVDAWHRGDYSKIADAIKDARPGDRIIVRPGLYQEALVIDKSLEIIGDGELSEIVVQATNSNVILFNTTMGRVSNLTLRQMGGGKWYCVNITQGRLELEGCDIISQSLSCVAIHNGADPRLRRNRIQDSKENGVIIYENGQGTLEDNEIFDNALSGVNIKTGGNPTLRRNRIYDNKQGGVYVYDNGQGTLEDNEIFDNALSGVSIKGGGNPTLHHNSINDNKQGGVYVYENGRGTLEDNDISGNNYCGVTINTGGNPTLQRNLINKNEWQGIWVLNDSGGTFEDNDLRDNKRGAWRIDAGSKAKVKRSGNLEE
jgi:F-box protein 11